MEAIDKSIEDYIRRLEQEGKIDPECGSCKYYFYPELLKGRMIHDIFAPSHNSSPRCESGKHPHCTCDTCF